MRHVKRAKGIKRGQKTPRWSLLPTANPSGPFVSTSTLWADMMTSSNGNNFRVTRPLCEWFNVHWWIPLTKACDAELWCFRWCLNKRLSKQSRSWWFDTPSRSLWRHCNEKSPGKNVISKKEDYSMHQKTNPQANDMVTLIWFRMFWSYFIQKANIVRKCRKKTYICMYRTSSNAVSDWLTIDLTPCIDWIHSDSFGLLIPLYRRFPLL